MAKTKAPTGLAIARNANKFVCTWKIADSDYGDGQSFKWRVNKKSYTSVSIGKTTTQKTVSLTLSNYYPTTSTKLTRLEFGVKGNRKSYSKNGSTVNPGASEWSYKEFELKKPSKPSLSASLSDSYANVTTFSWSYPKSDTSHVIFRDCQYQSILVQDSNVTDGSELAWESSNSGWRTGTSSDTGSVTISEDAAALATASFTRWVRVRARSVSGVGSWKYAKHVYATPYQANIRSTDLKDTNSGGYLCTVEWTASSPASHHIDYVTVQYGIGTPAANMGCPSGLSWTDAGVLKDTSNVNALAFSIDTVIGSDECLWVRVNTTHDTTTTYGAAELVAAGALSAPSSLSVTTNNTTHRATVRATNNSAVPDAFLAVYYMTQSQPDGICVGVIPHGSSSATVQCPDWSTEQTVTFGVRAIAGSYTALTRSDGVTVYALSPEMTSPVITYGGTVPQAPGSVSLATTDVPGTVQVTFSWTWTDADSAEISWADHADAWMSTDEPETYIINNTHAARWNISGLEIGKTWYVRVRLMSGADDVTYGSYSDIVSIDLSSTPVRPVLTLSDTIITKGGSLTASWVYVSTDGTLQGYAQVAELRGSTYTVIAEAESAQHCLIDTSGWATGEEHQLAVRVMSLSGKTTDWSDAVSVIVAEPLSCVISSTSIHNITITNISDGNRTVKALTALPLTATITGAGSGGETTLSIVRRGAYHIDRPDESTLYGYDGETVCVYTQTGEDAISIDAEDLIGTLDDGAGYTLIAAVADGLQTAETSLDFEVHWAHQAKAPTASVIPDNDYIAAYITATAPTGAENDDMCDIYRLSADKPVLIVKDGTFGETYVDPYPTLGDFGGYRIVTRTAEGDYTTSDNKMAWIDVDCVIDGGYTIIDFDGGRVTLYYNMDLSSRWAKSFQSTSYLGGSVQGDWNPDVLRSGSVAAVSIAEEDQDTIEAMRRLAEHTGICHVRTRDGSSYPADVQVSESYSGGHGVAEFSLTITRVDTEILDGMTEDEWNAVHSED